MFKRTTALLLLACIPLVFTGNALAQDSAAEAPQAAQTEVRDLVQQLRQKSAKLRQIHAQTLQNNTDLRQQQEQFIAMMRDEIKAQGYDIEAGQKRLQDMTGKLKNGDLDDAERQTVMQKIAGERQSLQQARSTALQQPDIQQASQDLQSATMTAMQQQNPDVQELIDSMDSLRQQLRAAIQKQQAPSNG